MSSICVVEEARIKWHILLGLATIQTMEFMERGWENDGHTQCLITLASLP